MTESDEVMQQTWCCLTCSAKFRWGEVRMAAGGLHCPRCDAVSLHPAGGEVRVLDGYDGEIGTLN
ncbi:hypothetical protein ASF27_12220 [Methylobacterium sp. Leaf102]|uniref:Uncharacterized protein n=2 Tax=Methylobacterium TaxID=407 RepID=A0A679IXI1_9HYPH|nr:MULTISPECIES: hypothetical protein [Methylobacterium]GJE17184.1 hypothetical protein AIGOOFII_1897 [Methylobacterium marchantiae]KQP18586.1 hypothetical protein ASF25_12095 [Methylobacterium sp. Leaf100]KQP23927.1 hypothetical protein ASF27_12220 [Methylobacterium sp. Leaf102]MBD8904687.1 hypothetical protein [Methylobacterium bullatum]CAA2104542.1 hypothetical protein MBUL_02756 [Methylobacterium bullatum]